jgi:hypothetical protein
MSTVSMVIVSMVVVSVITAVAMWSPATFVMVVVRAMAVMPSVLFIHEGQSAYCGQGQDHGIAMCTYVVVGPAVILLEVEGVPGLPFGAAVVQAVLHIVAEL